MTYSDLSSRKQNALFWQEKMGHPEEKLHLIAVTGTNGKTTVSSLLCSLLEKSGKKAGLIGTVECFDGIREAPSDYTTPPPELLYPMLCRMVENGITTVVMEASSHALSQERLFGLRFQLAIFTNLSRDHLDYHKTVESYLAAKAKLFSMADISLICSDDDAAEEIARHACGDVYYYGETNTADFRIQDAVCTPNGIAYTLRCKNENLMITAPLVGAFNVQNTAAALSAAYLLGCDKTQLPLLAKTWKPPVGRLEKLSGTGDITVFIDYAHTPDALQKVLLAVRGISKKLTVLFGAGGDRDQGKRSAMGKIAEDIADFVIVSSDNPRSEDPEMIANDILSGMQKSNHIVILNRKKAIIFALSQAKKGETILLAGKGHENYLITKDGKQHFSEKEIVQEFFNAKGT